LSLPVTEDLYAFIGIIYNMSNQHTEGLRENNIKPRSS